MDEDVSNRVERRCGHRFQQYQVPVTFRTADGSKGNGFTLDLSSRGALLWTDSLLCEGQMLEMCLVMPSEITLAEDMSVRCRARVLRVDRAPDATHPAVAVRIEHYEFLPREISPAARHDFSLHASHH